MSKPRCDLWGGVPQKVAIHIDREGVPGFLTGRNRRALFV